MTGAEKSQIPETPQNSNVVKKPVCRKNVKTSHLLWWKDCHENDEPEDGYHRMPDSETSGSKRHGEAQDWRENGT